jgi:hypothetical protein
MFLSVHFHLFMSYLMHMQFIVILCFNYLIIIIYCFAYICTYVVDVPPQHGDEVIEEAEDPPTLVHTPHAMQDGYESSTRGDR